MEVSQDGNIVYIAGKDEASANTGRAKIIACSFDRFLRQINQVELNSLDYNRINRMKRIDGEETLIAGDNKHFSVVEMKNKSTLEEVGNIPNVHQGDILDFEFRDRYIYSKGANESMVKVTTLGVKREAPPPVPIIRENPTPVVYKQSKYETFKRTKIECPFITGNTG